MNLPLGAKFTNQQTEHIASSWKTTESLIMNNIAVLLSPPSSPFTCYQNYLHAMHAHLYYILRSFRERLRFYLFSNFLLKYLLWKVSNICKQAEKKNTTKPYSLIALLKPLSTQGQFCFICFPIYFPLLLIILK